MKGLKDFSKEAAAKLGVDESVAYEVNKFFWNNIRRATHDLSYPSIYIKNLGTLNLSRYKLYKSIVTEIKRIRAVRANKELIEERKDQILKTRIKRLRLLLTKRNQLAKIWADYQNISKWSELA